MKRLLVLVTLLAIVLAPGAAGAQGEVIINELQVRLWPEYDRSDLLVIYDLFLAPGTSMPASLQLRVPLDAQVTAVAQETQGGLFSLNFTTAVEGDWQVVSFEATDQTGYRLEYYAPVHKQGAARHFNYFWAGDYPVNTLVVEVQEPTETSDFRSFPELPNTGVSPDSLPTHSGTFSSLGSGEEWVLDATYSRATDELTVSGQPVQPSGGVIDNGASGSEAVLDFLSRNMYYILGFLGVLLIVGGLFWYWQAGSSHQTGTSRKRHISRGESSSADGQVYCHECGKRAQPADKFCRACGARIRREDS